MNTDNITANARDLEKELAWFSRVLDTRLKLYFDQEAELGDIYSIPPPVFDRAESPYAAFITEYDLDFMERIALILALIPHIRPRLLDVFFTKNKTFDRQFTEFGGEVVAGAFLPTGQTLAFVLAAEDLAVRFKVLNFLSDPRHLFAKAGVLRSTTRTDTSPGEPFLNARLTFGLEYITRFTTGEAYRPILSKDFPAQYITTELTWDDLVLDPETLNQLNELKIWIEHSPTLMDDWGFNKKLRPGYRSLFYGPPGTGKTMTACLLGQFANKDVYKIDLSQVVSKYIGETEKNLSNLFDIAQHKGWILFFDEADALFGKRTQTKDAHDRYANQEIAYLLQRIEIYDGIAILASNMKSNIDSAFMRRFESVVHFPMPGPAQRLRLWENSFPDHIGFGIDVSLHELANQHELTGASIMNIARDTCLLELEECNGNRDGKVVTRQQLEIALTKEYRKEERVKG